MTKVAGRFTIRTTAVFFALSAVVEVASIRTPVPLLGAMRSGLAGGAYHVVFVLAFLAVGLGLWTAARWSPATVYAVTLIYTLDKLRYLLDRPAREAELLYQLRDYPEILDTFPMDAMLQLVTLVTLVFVACWLGFTGYIYLKRGYFAEGGQPELRIEN